MGVQQFERGESDVAEGERGFPARNAVVRRAENSRKDEDGVHASIEEGADCAARFSLCA